MADGLSTLLTSGINWNSQSDSSSESRAAFGICLAKAVTANAASDVAGLDVSSEPTITYPSRLTYSCGVLLCLPLGSLLLSFHDFG